MVKPLVIRNASNFDRDKQGTKGLAAPLPYTQIPAEALPLRSGTTLRSPTAVRLHRNPHLTNAFAFSSGRITAKPLKWLFDG
jgi:hypothetical protein